MGSPMTRSTRSAVRYMRSLTADTVIQYLRGHLGQSLLMPCQSVDATSSAETSQSLRAAAWSRAASLGCFGLPDAQ